MPLGIGHVLVVLVVAVVLSAVIGSTLGAVIGRALRCLTRRLGAVPTVGPTEADLGADSLARGLWVEEYRRRFRVAPIGTWTGASGTFGVVMNETWRFRPDGTGELRAYGPFGHPSGEDRRFDWIGGEERTVSLRGLGDDPEGWVSLRYDFRPVQTDSGIEVAMVGVDEFGVAQDGFGRGLAGVMEQPLSYVGPEPVEGRSVPDSPRTGTEPGAADSSLAAPERPG